jgi:hypothetical protein
VKRTTEEGILQCSFVLWACCIAGWGSSASSRWPVKRKSGPMSKKFWVYGLCRICLAIL